MKAFLVLATCATVLLGQHWEFEQVDTARACGAELALLPDGRLAVCYTTYYPLATRFAVRDSTWLLENVGPAGLYHPPALAVGPHGTVGAAWYEYGTRYAIRTDSGWDACSLPVLGTMPRLSYDSAGVPHVLAEVADGDDRYVVMAVQQGQSWWVETVQHGMVGSARMDFGPAAYRYDNQPSVFVSDYVDIRPYFEFTYQYWLDRQGLVWQARWILPLMGEARALGARLVDGIDPCFTYAWLHDAGEFDPETVGVYCDLDRLDEPACDAALQLDENDDPHVAFVCGTASGRLKYAFRSGGEWQRQFIPDTNLAVDCDMLLVGGKPIVAYTRADGGVWLARGDGTVGVAEGPPAVEPSAMSGPTVARAASLARYECRVRDIQGRDVTARRDRLAPGVYFLSPVERGVSGVRRVVVPR